MLSNKTKSLTLTLGHEGGYSNNPNDPGGPTMKGITQAVYDAYRKGKGLDVRSVKLITSDELGDIYANQYMAPVHFDDLPSGLDYAVFDFAVNSGPGKAMKVLQQQLGVPVDGKYGLITAAAITATPDVEALVVSYCADRVTFLKSLRTWNSFGKGWTRRVEGDQDGEQDGDMGVVDLAGMMARGDKITKAMTPSAIGSKDGEVNAKAPPTDVAITKTATGKGLITTAGGIGTAAIGAGTSLVKGMQPVADAAKTAGSTAQTVAAAAVQVHHASTSVFSVYGHLIVNVLLGGGFTAAMGGCAFFGYHYYKHMKEQGQ